MEATGYYHYQLAYQLLKSGLKVSVENPLSLKRFVQMKLSKIRTDRSYSKLIPEYAQKVELKQLPGKCGMSSNHQSALCIYKAKYHAKK